MKVILQADLKGTGKKGEDVYKRQPLRLEPPHQRVECVRLHGNAVVLELPDEAVTCLLYTSRCV